MNQLLINGQDGHLIWGIMMGDKFLNALYTPSHMKPHIENTSNSISGKDVVFNNKSKDRDITLVFNIHADNPMEYLLKYKSFVQELKKGTTEIEIVGNGERFSLNLISFTSYAMSEDRCSAKVSVKFNEPQPSI